MKNFDDFNSFTAFWASALVITALMCCFIAWLVLEVVDRIWG